MLVKYCSRVFALQLVSTAILIVTLVIVGRQVAEGRRAAYSTAYAVVREILQSPETRAARRHVLTQLDDPKKFDEWSTDDKQIAEIVCQSYDDAAIMCRRGMLPANVVADSWGDSLRRSWPIVLPLVVAYREKREAPELWDDFEWMAELAAHSPGPSMGRLQRCRNKVGDWIGGSDRPR